MACKVPVHARRPADATQGGEEETKDFFFYYNNNNITTVVVFVVVLLVCFIRVRIINYYYVSYHCFEIVGVIIVVKNSSFTNYNV